MTNITYGPLYHNFKTLQSFNPYNIPTSYFAGGSASCLGEVAAACTVCKRCNKLRTRCIFTKQQGRHLCACNPFKLNMEKRYLTQQRTQTGHGDALKQYVRNWSIILRLHTVPTTLVYCDYHDDGVCCSSCNDVDSEDVVGDVCFNDFDHPHVTR